MCTKIKGIFEMNKMFNKNICLKRCLCMYFADNQWVLLIANIFNISAQLQISVAYFCSIGLYFLV